MTSPVTTVTDNPVNKALAAARQIVPPQVIEQGKELVREQLGKLSQEAKDTVARAADSGVNLATDAVIGPLHTFLQGAKAFPFGESLMKTLGTMVSKAAKELIPTATKINIPETIFMDICYTPEKVNAEVVKQLDAIRNHPRVKTFIDTITSPSEWGALLMSPDKFIAKCKDVLGIKDEAKPAAKKDTKNEKPGFFRACVNWIAGFAGPSDPKEIEAKLKGAGAIKSTWYKLPPIGRKVVVFGGGALVALKAVTIGFFAAKIAAFGIVAWLGKGMFSKVLGGGNSDVGQSKKKGMFSFLNPRNWFGKKSAVASPVDAAEQAAAPRSNGGGFLNKIMGHASTIANGVQAAQRGDLGGLANMARQFTGGGAPQNN